MAQAALGQDERMLTFQVGNAQFGVAAALVREVTRMPRVTHVPHSPAGMLGLGNFRGEVLPIVSFGQVTGHAHGQARRVILLDTANPIALAVDDVSAFGAAAGLHAIDAEALAQSGSHAGTSVPRRVTTRVARHEASTVEADVPLVAFMAGNQEFALPIRAVSEVLRLPDTVAVLPHGDAVVVGSIASRDGLLPLLSLPALLGLPAATARAHRPVVVVRIGSHRVGLVVDGLRGVLRVAESRIDVVPPVLARGTSEAKIQAICRLDDGARLVSVLAVEHLVREDLTTRLLATAGMDQDVTTSGTHHTTEAFLLFSIGDTRFGLPIGSVIEVARPPARLGRLPKAPPFVKGIMTLRGLAVPVIDQSLRFVGAAASGGRQRVIVVRIGALIAGFLVDAVADVRHIAVDTLRPVPEFGDTATHVFDRIGTGDDDAAMVLIISPQQLLDRAERDLLGAISGKAVARVP